MLKFLLFPFALIYDLITSIRNWLFDIGIFKAYQSKIYTINIGNLTVGGTGKTPHVEYLIRLLSDNYDIAILSRGYRRNTKGFILADENSTAELIGDEPMQFYLKYRNKIKVAVCESRVEGAKKLESLFPNLQILLLDDAFQHRAIKPHFNILLTESNRLFVNDFLMPIGRLRENMKGAKRADLIIISKSQKPSPLPNSILKFNIPIIHSGIKYGELKSYWGDDFKFDLNQKTIAFSGIAKPQLFNEYVEKKFKIQSFKNFSDHYNFKRNDIAKLLQNIDYQFITTEKDFVKIKSLLTQSELKQFFYLPIEVVFWKKPQTPEGLKVKKSDNLNLSDFFANFQ